MTMQRSDKIPLKGGDEQDALTPYKRFLTWGSHCRKNLKNQYSKRKRKMIKKEILEEEKNGYFSNL